MRVVIFVIILRHYLPFYGVDFCTHVAKTNLLFAKARPEL